MPPCTRSSYDTYAYDTYVYMPPCTRFEYETTLQLGQLVSYTDISQYCFPAHFWYGFLRTGVYGKLPTSGS